AYRQSSLLTRAAFERDPYNRLLARGPRFRMEAEMIRDAMLAASGLLSTKIGGPSVFPLQADTSGVVAINKVDTAWAPRADEVDLLASELKRQTDHYRRNPAAAKAVFKSHRDTPVDPVAAAAWTMVANILINLDETLTKE